jgi:predicted small lipoprotein YifL
MRHLAILAMVISFLAVSACGLKDNLYLPGSKPARATKHPVPAEPSDQKQDEGTTGAKPAPPSQ